MKSIRWFKELIAKIREIDSIIRQINRGLSPEDFSRLQRLFVVISVIKILEIFNSSVYGVLSERLKHCYCCNIDFDILYRVSTDSKKSWFFYCDECLKKIKTSEYYIYGGTWKKTKRRKLK